MADILAALEAAGVDVPGAMKRFCGNRELYLKYILLFPADEDIASYRQCMLASDYEAARHRMHSFKGVSGNLGMMTLYNFANDILAQLKAGDYAAIEDSQKLLDAEFARICAVISANA